MIESLLDSIDLDALLERVSGVGWVQELVLVAAFLAAALIIDFVIGRVLALSARRTDTDLDDRIIKILHRPILATVIGLGLWVVTLRAELAEAVRAGIGRTLITVLLLVWAIFAVKFGLLLLEGFSRLQERKQLVKQRMLPLTAMITRVVVIGVAGYLLLSIWGLDVKPLLGSAAVLGLVLGLAAKDSLGNLFAGISIMLDAPYQIGDYIVLDGGERGRVTKVGLRSTRLLTLDDIEITIPNTLIGNTKIVNESGGPAPAHRVRAEIQVAYGTDVDRLRELLTEIAVADPLIAEHPEPRVRMRGFGESGIDFQLMGWVSRPELRGRALDSIYVTVYERLAAEGIEIPFPMRRVLLDREQA